MALQCKVGFFCCCLWVVGLGFVCFFDKMKCCAQYIRMLHYTFFFLKSKLPLSLFTLKDFCFVGIYKSSVFPVFDLSIFFPPKKEQKQCENVFWALSCTLHKAICTQNLLQKQNLLSQVSEQWNHCWKESETRAWREKSHVFQSYRHKLYLIKYLKNPSRQLAFDSNCR